MTELTESYLNELFDQACGGVADESPIVFLIPPSIAARPELLREYFGIEPVGEHDS